MTIIAWNMRRANASNDAAWDYFRELNADVALLQEVTSIPNVTLRVSIARRTFGDA